MASDLMRLVRPSSEVSSLNRAYILVGIADGTLLTFIPLYLLDRGLPPAVIGVALASSAAAWLVTSTAVAYLADRLIRPERLVVLSALAAALVAMLFALPGGPWLSAAVAVALSAARCGLPLLDPIALRKLRTTSRTDYARIRLRTSAGWAVSVTMAGALYEVAGLRLIPFIYAPLSVLVALWVWYALPTSTASDTVALPTAEVAAKLTRIPLALVVFLASAFLLGGSLAATQNFLTLQINVLGGGALLVAAAAAFQALTEIPTMGFTHVLAARMSHRTMFAIGCAIYVLMFIAWGLVSSALVAALLKLFAGMAFALTFVASVMLANELSPPRLRATGQALVKSVTFGLAPIFGAFGGGIVYGALGARPMFLLSTFAVGAAGVIALMTAPPRRREPAGERALSTTPVRT